MMNRKKICIEAQRLFRKQKHGMDVVALELLRRLRNADTDFDMQVLVKEDADPCLENGSVLSVQTLKPVFYPLWEQWILPRFLAAQNPDASLLHCTGNTAPLWGKTPLLITIHDLIFMEENSPHPACIWARLSNRSERTNLRSVRQDAPGLKLAVQTQKPLNPIGAVVRSEMVKHTRSDRLLTPATKRGGYINFDDQPFGSAVSRHHFLYMPRFGIGTDLVFSHTPYPLHLVL